MAGLGQASPDLESFRAQWRAEVQAKTPASPAVLAPGPAAAGPSSPASNRPLSSCATAAGRSRKPLPQAKKVVLVGIDDDDDNDSHYRQPWAFDEPDAATAAETRAGGKKRDESSAADEEPASALDVYERAVEKEAAGVLGDSLKLYRKAYRIDDRVDHHYRNKHFPPKPPTASKPPHASTASADGASPSFSPSTSTIPGPLVRQQQQPPAASLPIKDLIASFSRFTIQPPPPEVEGVPPPPCPLAALPDEILVHILRDVADLDVGDFVRLARVCRRLAYLVAAEDRIWRRICLGTAFGFGGMHYRWQRRIDWGPLSREDVLREAEAEAEAEMEAMKNETLEEERGEGRRLLTPKENEAAGQLRWLTFEQRAARLAEDGAASTALLLRTAYGGSWQRMFRTRPRIRFNGCYISTVNYISAGATGANSIVWNNPVHIVTYYRYLRFFRDGTVLSLRTTSEPADVVHSLTREAVQPSGGRAHNTHTHPHGEVRTAYRGRWRLGSPFPTAGESISPSTDGPSTGRQADPAAATAAAATDESNHLYVETEGVGKYIYRLDLSLRSAGVGAGTRAIPGATRNNKLAWRGFWSYDTLADDWAEFALKNDKPFFFSRVRSYGVMGE